MTFNQDVVQLHLMTFRDIYQQIAFICILGIHTACWAPEVEPPAPKLSPAEIAGLSIATASASSLNPEDSPKNKANFPSEGNVKPNTITPTQSERIPNEPQDVTIEETVKVFPYQATIHGSDVPLLGHGGGVILRLTEASTQSAVIEVLEEQAGKARVLCRGCSKSHPFQAGWISLDYLKANN